MTTEIVVVVPVVTILTETADDEDAHQRNRRLNVKCKGSVDETGPDLNHGNDSGSGSRNDAALVQRSEQLPPLRLKPVAEPMKVMTASMLAMVTVRAAIYASKKNWSAR